MDSDLDIPIVIYIVNKVWRKWGGEKKRKQNGVVVMMFVSKINVCMHRRMFAEKEGFGKGVMWCSSDRQQCEVRCMKNVTCRVHKCCCFFFSFVVWLSTTYVSNLRVSCRVLARRNLLGRGVRSSSSSFRWPKGHQHATKCMYTPDALIEASISTRLVEGGGGDGEDVGGPLSSLASKLVLTMQSPPRKSQDVDIDTPLLKPFLKLVLTLHLKDSSSSSMQ